ncbi:hypothetical protein [Shewanella algae]|uniref:hypothetical protein n=1 Tax=Shewanella algae TaxID=38313 RepID=UPI001AAEDA00|nr:hypothetical protein [Shewanella algae]MBO2590369.1 hypothetical protein [Shewanella algae]
MNAKLKRIFSNIGHLSAIKLLTMGLPLFVYPVIISTIGKESFGEILLFQTVVGFLLLFISYGFNLSAVKTLSEVDQYSAIVRVFSSVFWSKALIALLVSFIAYALNFYIPSDISKFFCLAFFYILGELFLCQYFFHGRSIVKQFTYLVFVVRLVFFFIMLYALDSDVTSFYVAAIFSIEYFAMGLLSFFVAVYFSNINIRVVSLRDILLSIKEGGAVFLVVFVTALKDKFNLVIVAIFFTTSMIVVVDFSIKILTLLAIPSSIISMAAYPTNSRLKSKKLLYGVILSGLLVTCVAYALFVLTLDFFNLKYFNFNDKSIDLIYLVVASVFFLCISSIVATNGLIAQGHNSSMLNNVIINTSFYFVSLGLVYLFTDFRSVDSFLSVIVLTYAFEAVTRIYMARKLKVI